jgi:CubicO group peptidase (beta-lactamase class C family)
LQRLDAFLHQAVQSRTIPGAVVCVAHRGQIVWHQAYGAAALIPQQCPMRRETLFDIASLTKVVVTTSLLLLAHHEGVCSLEDTLCCFYPNLANTALGAVTLRQLLAHTGGLEAWCPLYQALFPAGPAISDTGTAQARRRQAARIILQKPLAYAPGSRVVYSDLGFIVLADVLEAQYQQPLDILFLQRVVRPLDLHSIAYLPLDDMASLPPCPTAYAATEACAWRERVLVGEVHDENAWAMGGVAGHAGLFATAESLWHFTHALLETAAGRRHWLPAALLQESWQRHPSPPDSTRALGWDTPTPGRSSAGAYFSPHAIGHLGFTGCSLWIDLEHQVTVILCTNRVHPTRHATGITRLRPAVHNLIMQAVGVATS